MGGNDDNCFDDLEATGKHDIYEGQQLEGYEGGGQHDIMNAACSQEVMRHVSVMTVAPSVDNVMKLQNNELNEDDDREHGDSHAVCRVAADNVITDSDVISVTIFEGEGGDFGEPPHYWCREGSTGKYREHGQPRNQKIFKMQYKVMFNQYTVMWVMIVVVGVGVFSSAVSAPPINPKEGKLL